MGEAAKEQQMRDGTKDNVELTCLGCGSTFLMARELFDRVTKKRSDYCSYACFEQYVLTGPATTAKE
jgi:hypothetical protein